jgi:hypothetical protein
MDSGMHFVADFFVLGNALLKVGRILNLNMAYIIYKLGCRPHNKTWCAACGLGVLHPRCRGCRTKKKKE